MSRCQIWAARTAADRVAKGPPAGYDGPMFAIRERRRPAAVADLVPVLARQLLTAEAPPSRLPTVRELAREHHSSLSSIHFALSRLEESGAVEIESRGRSGAFMIGRSLAGLWGLAENGRPLVIALPLASSPRYEALATAIKQILTRESLEVFLVFVRGSRQRLEAVRDGRCHLAAMSAFAAAELCGPTDQVVVELPPLTYNTGHRVFYKAAADDDAAPPAGDHRPPFGGPAAPDGDGVRRRGRAPDPGHGPPDRADAGRGPGRRGRLDHRRDARAVAGGRAGSTALAVRHGPAR